MEELTEIVGRLCNILEDAKAEGDWELVDTVIIQMDELYEDLERRSSDPFQEY